MKRVCHVLALAILISSFWKCAAQTRTSQSNTRITAAEFRRLATRCAPDIPLITLRAIARTESAFHPYALSLNYPRRTARAQGFSDGGIFLSRQPETLSEGLAWAHCLVREGASVSIGLMQVSTLHASALGLTADELFDPCTNVRAGAQILRKKYQRIASIRGQGQEALGEALSEYNSGSPFLGFQNGYVSNVVDGEFFSRHVRRYLEK